MGKHRPAQQKNTALPGAVIGLLLAAAALQVSLALFTQGHRYDTSTFLAWALRMADMGPGGFYAPNYFADYPPGYMLVLWPVGLFIRTTGVYAMGPAAKLALCAAPICADLALGVLFYRMAQAPLGEKGARLAAAAALFCPLLWFDSAVWKQVDAPLALALLGAFWALDQKKYLQSGLLYGLSLLIKPQALLFGPVYAIGFLLPLFFEKENHLRRSAFLGGIQAFFACIGLMAAVSLPFTGERTPFVWLAQLYGTTAGSYKYASLNACSLPALLGANWTPQDDIICGLSWKSWGTIGILLCLALLVWFAVMGQKNGRADLFLLAGFFCCGIFTLSHAMHERYLLPGAVFLFAAGIRLADRRLLALAGAESLICFANTALLYLNVWEDQFLSAAPAALTLRFLAFLQLLAFCLLAVLCVRICVKAQPLYLQNSQKTAPKKKKAACSPEFFKEPPAVPALTRKEMALLGASVLLAAAVALAGLGDLQAPQSGCKLSEQRSFTLEFAEEVTVVSLFSYPGIGSGNVTLSDGANAITAQQSNRTVFCWQTNTGASTLSAGPGRPLTLTVDPNMTVYELALRDTAGQDITCFAVPAGAEALFDEADMVPQRSDRLNSMYFDEIYHGRTAFELVHGLDEYETTHPPLGKLLIGLGIRLFGMTPFGWRVVPALFGAALIGAVCWLVLQLCGDKRAAALAAVLYGLEPSRFVQSRLATIDIFVVFFITLSAAFLLRACRVLIANGPAGTKKDLFLAGALFGAGCACKWTGVYAGIGFAVCYFGAFWLRSRRLAEKDDLLKKEAAQFIGLGCLLFAALPVLVYVLTWLPWFAKGGFGVKELIAYQQHMFGYHSGLDATHPFQSVWYSWLVGWRPVWYYMAGSPPAGKYGSIALIGGPLLFWCGLAAIMYLFYLALRCRQTGGEGFVLVLWTAQLLPWVLITRAAFLYHYLGCVPFLAAAVAFCWCRLQAKNRKTARRLALALGVCAVCQFVFFYPALTGIPVGAGWANAMELLPAWGFYIT